SQPTISPLFNTRQAQDSFLRWAGVSTEYYDFLQENWTTGLFANQTDVATFQEFWDRALYNGVYTTGAATVAVDSDSTGVAASLAARPAAITAVIDASAAASAVVKRYPAESSGLALSVYQKVGIGNGTFANNPWLQEMADPITKATWDNYITVSQKWANEQGLKMFEGATTTARLTVGDKSIVVPVLIQPGQADGTIGLALGYGMSKAGRVANGV